MLRAIAAPDAQSEDASTVGPVIPSAPVRHDGGRERLGLQIGLQGLGRLAALCLNMATFALILGGLSPAEYGSAALALTLADVVGTVAAFGLDTTVFRSLSVREMDGGGFGAAVLLRLGLAAVAGALAILVVLMLPDSPLRLPMIVAFASMPLAALVTMQQVLRARVRLIPFAISDVASSLLALAFIVGFTAYGLDAVDVVMSTVLSNAIVWVALALISWRELRPRVDPGRFIHDAWDLLVRSRMLAVGDATVVAYYRADVVALGVTTGGASLGIYAAAYRFVNIAMYAQSIVIGAFFPRIARAWADPAELRALLREVGGFLLALATIAFIAVVTLGPAVIELFGGESYGDITVLVVILMTVTAVMFVNRLLIQTLVAGGFAARQAACWTGGLIGAALAFPLSALMAERGAGLAMLIGEALILAIALHQLRGLDAVGSRTRFGLDGIVLAGAAAAGVFVAGLPNSARLPAGLLLSLVLLGATLLRVRRRGLAVASP